MHHSSGEERVPANEAVGVQVPSLDTGMKTKLCFNWWFHLSWTASLHFCKGRAVSCTGISKAVQAEPKDGFFSPPHHMRRCKWTNCSPCTLTQCIGVAKKLLQHDTYEAATDNLF